MSSAKKFKDYYPNEKTESLVKKNDSTGNLVEEKKMVKLYQEQIKKLLEDTKNQKKAALIIEQLINSSKK